jgi:proline iminopeptidase
MGHARRAKLRQADAKLCEEVSDYSGLPIDITISVHRPEELLPIATAIFTIDEDANGNYCLSSGVSMNRRDLLVTTAASIVTATAGAPVEAVARAAQSDEIQTERPDGLNPAGIRTAGIRMVPVVAGKYKVWTKKIGSGSIKVLLLHGGPGFSHEYLEAFESFLPQAGIEMYYYDQLGCNNSDQPDDFSLWTLARYTEEVEEVRRALGLEHFVLYGHSWGGMLAIEYALNYQRHLSGLVISNMTAGMRSYLKRTASIKTQLPPETLARLTTLEAKEDYDSPEYQRIMMEDLYPKMLCRIQPWPEPLSRAFRHANDKIYNLMQGKSEFLVTGNLKDWERWDRLHEIRVKALTIGAQYDEMDPEDMKKMATLMANGQNAFCPHGSHGCMWDDQNTYFDQLLKFLNTV